MRRILLLLLLMGAPLAWAQEPDESEAAAPDATEPSEETASDTDESVDDIEDLDGLYPAEDDDEFIPSEDVAFGQSIPFPTDI